MNKKEAAIVTGYTGMLLGDFNEAHKYMQQKIGRPLYTHELANKSVIDEIRNACEKDFINITVED